MNDENIYKINIDDIYNKCKKIIDEENEYCKEERFTLENYEYLIDIISDYFFDNKIFEKIRKKIIKLNKRGD